MDRHGIDLVRYAVKLFNSCNETFNQRFSGSELLRLAEACQKSEWDIYPDEWEERQVQECIQFGTVPTWQMVRANEWGGEKLVAVYKQDGKNEYTVSISMTRTADVRVHADTLEDAIKWVSGDCPLPLDTEYLDNSFEVDQENTEYLNEDQQKVG